MRLRQEGEKMEETELKRYATKEEIERGLLYDVEHLISADFFDSIIEQPATCPFIFEYRFFIIDFIIWIAISFVLSRVLFLPD
jgi:hypothetical protein